MKRRPFIGSVSAATVGSLAGCAQPNENRDTPNRELTAQNLTDHGWKQIDQSTTSDTYTIEKFGFSKTITVTGSTTVYGDAALRNRIKEETLGQLDTTVRIFFNTELTLDPNPASLPQNIGVKELLDKVEPQVKQSFADRLSTYGLTNVTEHQSETFTVDTGEDARLFHYTATYPYEDLSLPVAGDAQVTIPSGEVKFGALLALWEHNDKIFVAGGGHPVQNVTEKTSVDITNAISADISIDLQLAAKGYNDELRSLIATTK